MSNFIILTLIVTGLLCVLNVLFACIFRKRHAGEVFSYVAAALVELIIFGVVLALRLNILTSIPYHLPPRLPFNRVEIAAAIALGIGLFPAAYWHRTSLSQLRARMSADAKVMKQRDAGVHIKSNTPGEWMN